MIPRGRADHGSGMIMTILIVVLVTALGATATALAVGNLRGSTSAQQAGTALDSAEAGISQATAYLRTYGTRKLRCGTASCTANAWNPNHPVAANVAGGGRWEAYLDLISWDANTQTSKFRIHSTGTAGGPAQRVLETDVTASPIGLPLAVFGRTINLVGTPDLQQISMFSTGCVYKRSHLAVNNAAGVDLAYGGPAGVHTSQIITNSQGSGQFCPTTNSPIHNGLSAIGVSLLPCASSYPYDQDKFGGTLTGVLPALLPCAAASTNSAYLPRDFNGDGSLDVNGSFIKDDNALFKSFGIKRPALTASELDQLKATAQAQGNYYTATGGWTVPTDPHAVLFFDLSSGGTVNLDPLGGSVFSRARVDVSSPLCLDVSLMVVVLGGNARLNSNTNLAASIYLGSGAPYGNMSKANGGANHIGMIYGDTLDITGNFSVSLDTCYLANLSPALFAVTPGSYRELDR